MEMQNAKSRTLTTLVIAILAFSMVLIPIANALSAPTLSPSSGNVGDKITVSGASTTPGGLIQVYWDSVKAWDGKAGLLAEAYAVGTSYSVTIVIPNATQGTHYVIVKDVEASEVSFNSFTVNPKLTLNPSSVLPGDAVNVVGTGFAGSTSAVILYKPTENAVTNEAVGTGDGLTKAFYLDHAPVKYGSVTVKLGGTPTTGYTVDYVAGIIYFTTAPASGQAITADYTYYTATVTASASTNDVGFFTASFNVPSTETPGSSYNVLALDSKGNTVSVSLNVVAQKITLTPDKGYRGATVTVTGRGFAASKTVDIRWYLTTSDYITVVDDYPVGADGTFTTTFTVPAVPDPTEPGTLYTVKAIDTAGNTASATFTVVAPAQITLNPTSGYVDTIVTITGRWFTPGALITFTFDSTSLATTPTPVYADGNGRFSVSFKVPNVAAGTYTITATDEKGVSATATFKVTVPITVIKTRSVQYMPGDTISIYANSTESLVNVRLVITDPNGMKFFEKTLTSSDIETIGGFNLLKWGSSVAGTLPTDAPLGSWNFTAYSSAGKILATNLFTVSAKPSLQASLDENTAKILNQLNTVKSSLDTKLDSLAKQVSSLSDSVGSMSATVSSIKDTLTSSVTSIRNDISSVKGDIATLSSSMSTGFSNVNSALGTLTSSVNNLGGLSGQITSLGNTLSKSISDNANSIQTSIKNAQDAVSSQVKSSVGDLSTFLIIIGILAAITLVIEAAILIRRLS